MNITLALQAGATRDAVLLTLRERGHQVAEIANLADGLAGDAVPDVIIIDIDRFVAFREEEPMLYLRLSRRSRIVTVLTSLQFIDTAGILAFTDAFVFSDINLDRIEDACVLALDGHGIVPAQFLTIDGMDGVRLRKASALTQREYAVLQQLGNGLTNEQIGRALGITAATVKVMVRNTTSKLSLRNRTEAAVFADRQRTALSAARSVDVPA